MRRSSALCFWDLRGPLRVGSLRLWLSPAAPEGLKELLLLTADELTSLPEARLVMTKPITTVLELRLGGRRFYLKRYNDRGLKYGLRFSLGFGKGMRAAAGSATLAQAGFAVPKVLAVGRRLRPREDFVVAEAVGGALLKGILRGKAPFPPGVDADRLVSELGREIGRMHAAGIIHGDLNIGNVVVCGDARFAFLDAEKARRRRLTLARAARELADLNNPNRPLAGPHAAERFLEAYLLERPRVDGEALARATARASELRHGGSE